MFNKSIIKSLTFEHFSVSKNIGEVWGEGPRPGYLFDRKSKKKNWRKEMAKIAHCSSLKPGNIFCFFAFIKLQYLKTYD